MAVKIRRKHIVIASLATAAVLVVGAGVSYAVLDDDTLTGSERERAEAAALAEVGGGRVLAAEMDEDGGARHYELDVVDAGGAEWELVLDERFEVLVADRDENDRAAENEAGAGDTVERADGQDADDAPVSAADRERAAAAAAAAVTGGTAVDVDRSDDAGVAWEVEVVDGESRDWDVTLDEELTVLASVRD